MQLRAASITSFVSLTNLRLLTFPSHARPRFIVVIAKQIALNSDFPCYFFFGFMMLFLSNSRFFLVHFFWSDLRYFGRFIRSRFVLFKVFHQPQHEHQHAEYNRYLQNKFEKFHNGVRCFSLYLRVFILLLSLNGLDEHLSNFLLETIF